MWHAANVQTFDVYLFRAERFSSCHEKLKRKKMYNYLNRYFVHLDSSSRIFHQYCLKENILAKPVLNSHQIFSTKIGHIIQGTPQDRGKMTEAYRELITENWLYEAGDRPRQ